MHKDVNQDNRISLIPSLKDILDLFHIVFDYSLLYLVLHPSCYEKRTPKYLVGCYTDEQLSCIT